MKKLVLIGLFAMLAAPALAAENGSNPFDFGNPTHMGLDQAAPVTTDSTNTNSTAANKANRFDFGYPTHMGLEPETFDDGINQDVCDRVSDIFGTNDCSKIFAMMIQDKRLAKAAMRRLNEQAKE